MRGAEEAVGLKSALFAQVSPKRVLPNAFAGMRTVFPDGLV